jgi:hypothetical protein
VRDAWQLAAHQKITPGFAEKLCFTATATGSYEEAAQVANTVADVYREQDVARSTGPPAERARRYAQQLAKLKNKVLKYKVAGSLQICSTGFDSSRSSRATQWKSCSFGRECRRPRSSSRPR